MKRIIYIILFLFSVLGLAQQVKPVEQKKYYIHNTNDQIRYGNYYFKDVNEVLDKFLGTWKYQQNNESFEVTFIKIENRRSSSKRTADELAAHYKYIKDGVIVFDTSQEDFNENGYFISGAWFEDQNNVDQVKVYYSEPNFDTGDLASIKITYTPSQQLGQNPSLTFNRQNLRYPIEKNNEWTYNPYEVPNDLTLIKQ